MIGFSDFFDLEKWRKSDIEGGTTGIVLGEGEPLRAQFSYAVDLGNPGGGVSRRAAAFTTKVPATGTLSFHFRYDLFHAWFRVEAEFTAYTEKKGERLEQGLKFSNPGGTGERSFQGTLSFEVQKGGEFGFVLGGSNYDSTSTLRGTLTISDFTFTARKRKTAK